MSPAEILQGGVKIIQNRYLSYAPKVNWLDIVKDSSADVTILGNGPESERRQPAGVSPRGHR